MIKIVEITLDFVALISTNTHITGIFPQAAVAGTKLPFIIYRRNNINDHASKDGIHRRDVTFDIDIITNTYTSGLEVLDELTAILYGKQFVNPHYGYDVKVDNITESLDTEQELFIQTITCTIEAQN